MAFTIDAGVGDDDELLDREFVSRDDKKNVPVVHSMTHWVVSAVPISPLCRLISAVT